MSASGAKFHFGRASAFLAPSLLASRPDEVGDAGCGVNLTGFIGYRGLLFQCRCQLVSHLLHRHTKFLGNKVGNLVLEAVALLAGERHIGRVRADAQYPVINEFRGLRCRWQGEKSNQ